MKIFLFIVLIILTRVSYASRTDTISIYSKAMKQSFKCVVIKPSVKKKDKDPFPVLYLLHGWSGWYSNWIVKVPELQAWADESRIMIVCPEGGYSSWYFDSPIDSSMRLETYIGIEVPAYIDSHYSTINNRSARAIAGLSMGGHGALFIAMRHPELFGACGSMSGGVDLNDSRNRFDVYKRIGDTIKYASNWINYSVLNTVVDYKRRIENKKDSMLMIIDCGVDDFFFQGNQRLHKKMIDLKIPHEYIERPGNHSWMYWKNAVRYQLFYFRNFFYRN